MKYLPHSLVMHGLLAFVLIHTNSANTAALDQKVTVEIKETGGKPLFPETPPKYAIPGKGPGATKKQPDVDLSVYANRLKVKVDPVWVRNIQPYLGKTGKKYYTEVFIDVDKHGNIKSLRILKSSGYVEVDEVAIQTLREVGTLPIPPETLVKEGIIWEFSTF